MRRRYCCSSPVSRPGPIFAGGTRAHAGLHRHPAQRDRVTLLFFITCTTEFVLLPIDHSTACSTACLYLLIGHTIGYNLARDAPRRRRLHRRRTMEGRDSHRQRISASNYCEWQSCSSTIMTTARSFLLAFVLTYWRAYCYASCSWHSASWASPMAWRRLLSFAWRSTTSSRNRRCRSWSWHRPSYRWL